MPLEHSSYPSHVGKTSQYSKAKVAFKHAIWQSPSLPRLVIILRMPANQQNLIVPGSRMNENAVEDAHANWSYRNVLMRTGGA